MKIRIYEPPRVLFLMAILGTEILGQGGPLLGAQQRSETATFSQWGFASWYGAEFEGKPTASGEIFRSNLFTAAHRSLPFGTHLKVTNLGNGKSVVVRVNDRGPFVENRIIDLSRAAASALDMIHQGTTEVLIEVIVPGEASQPLGAATPQEKGLSNRSPETGNSGTVISEKGSGGTVQTIPSSSGLSSSSNRNAGITSTYRIQIASFRMMKNALSLYNDLKNKGFSVAYEEYQGLYRIVIPRIPQHQLEDTKKRLADYGFTNILVREELPD
ncbi:MAG TPA: septal ring lytic transglycosylase RlpA family protein [Termitinemataceae bacterium]|nr:septal ring lytic transglycosylase RlpA family protein [Termitinemataceae bacterium]HOM24477.1 septal ring lytic transglycosylase RlpA family protein [Termitinemataceae bacterium]HPQ01564.1 septal ring lytic transglycosylase RlpA family protein [Termitinemataceae bacterium]